ncbi:hypothetical protein F5B17DRAFT_182845 [Nemania serpens]|nr:hypothetical protein F5B17DRAFT_182845 [Nemania serpens]
MFIKHDATGSSQSYGVTKLEESRPILNQHNRQVPVHVTKQVARTADAECPPSNRQRARQPPSGNGEGSQQPGDNSWNCQFGNGNGGDGGGGNGSSPAVLRESTKRRHTDKLAWYSVWYCYNCGTGPNHQHNLYCHTCQARCNDYCKFERVKAK